MHKHVNQVMVCYPLSQDCKGFLITQNSVLSKSDPFLLAHWLEYSKKKLVKLLQDNISTTLHNILQHDERHRVCDDRNEEALIQVQLDVIQVLGRYDFLFLNTHNPWESPEAPALIPPPLSLKCLNAYVQASMAISHTLQNAVKRLCCDELHSFIQK